MDEIKDLALKQLEKLKSHYIEADEVGHEFLKKVIRRDMKKLKRILKIL